MLGAGCQLGTPAAHDAITDPGYFPFYSSGMSFEEFVRDFADWFHKTVRRR